MSQLIPRPFDHGGEQLPRACLQADATKARVQLGWEPKVTFEELIAIMVDADMEAIGLQPIGHGQQTLAARFAGWHQWSTAVTALQHGAVHKFE